MTASELSAGPKPKAKRKGKRPGKERAKLTELQVSKLHTMTLVTPSTIRRWAKGHAVTGPTEQRLGKAAAQIGVVVNP